MSVFCSEDAGIVPPEGMVCLADKLCPVYEQPPPYHPHYAYTRGVLDAKTLLAWKTQLSSMGIEKWNDKNQVGNVRMVRPAHDAWGINKIVFNFCDDFLQKVLDFPWGKDHIWRDLLCSVYKAAGIDGSKVVRCLLARLPPGVTIPVHHDTGYWVKHTHRLHMAIETHKDVEFRVGPTRDNMQKYLFDEGRIVELNNQAMHSVDNKTSAVYRVHLIFDYVDAFPITRRYQLEPGERLLQTRRSIDLASEVQAAAAAAAQLTTASKGADASREKHPAFIIIGAQKCGTTSLYEYICQHPLVLKGKRRETHYFDWRFNHSIGEIPAQFTSVCSNLPDPDGTADSDNGSSMSESVEVKCMMRADDVQEQEQKQPQTKELAYPGYQELIQKHRDYYMNFYEAAGLHKHLSLVTGESTPSYLLHSDIVIPRMLAVCPWAKVVVMLRNPVERAYSQYQMCIDPTGTPQQMLVRGESAYKNRSFEAVIREEIAELQRLNITPRCDYDTFRAHVLEKAPMNHGGHSLVARGLYVLQLRRWGELWPTNQLRVLSIAEIRGGKDQIQHTMNGIFEYLSLPPHDIVDAAVKNSRKYDPIPPTACQLLEDFYAAYNEELFNFLGRTLQW